ncbi:MAG: vorB [Clostridia bacterium]|jgi:2-oxoglutarate ferredoxin oxidoreductase subunit alpha|nr:vorB [Clostridia bacterium]
MDKVLMKGNEALAEAAIRAGCKHFFGYPITPQTEVSAYMAKKLPKIGGTFLQAESEVAAINMVMGASAAGIRAMTSSSSPGISLKSEGISYIAGCDLPCLIINVQRGGPGLGGIQPSQSDYNQATKAPGHGDFHLFVLAPSSVQEMVEFVGEAFDLAEIYRMPAMILADGILGQMMEPVSFNEIKKRSVPEKTWAAEGHKNMRTHNIINSLILKPELLEKSNFDRFERYKLLAEKEQRYEEYLMEDAEIVIVAFGVSARVAKSGINKAREQGIKVGLIRPITLYPFPVNAFLKVQDNPKVHTLLTVEMNMGQMIYDVKLAINCKKPVELLNHTGGIVPSPKEVYERIKKIAEVNK